MEKTLEEEIQFLKNELDLAYQEDRDRYDNAPIDMDFNQLMEYMSETSTKISVLDRKLRLIDIPIFEELSDYGDVIYLSEFIENVNSGGFIDYDGFGRYVKDGKESNITIYPSDVKHKMIRKDFDTIIWFNR